MRELELSSRLDKSSSTKPPKSVGWSGETTKNREELDEDCALIKQGFRGREGPINKRRFRGVLERRLNGRERKARGAPGPLGAPFGSVDCKHL